ncbi:MAG: hypothetical protein ACJATT_005705 [Myxococcota bacterium]|jgi:hypothetical protein
MRVSHHGSRDTAKVGISDCLSVFGAGIQLGQLGGTRHDTTVPEKHDKALNKLLHYVSQNADHMDSPRYRTRGMSVRSSAMASFHPIASQMRLKLAGARWLPKNALTIRNARMMPLAGRWAEFWDSPELTLQLQMAFGIGQEQAMKPVD